MGRLGKRKAERSKGVTPPKKMKIKPAAKRRKSSKRADKVSPVTKKLAPLAKPLKKIDILSKKSVIPGMLLLGAVLEVNKVHVVFSLPFNLRGILAITDVSDLVTDLVRRKAGGTSNSDTQVEAEVPTMEKLFNVGQLMPCYVQAIRGSLVNLSVNPQLTNAHVTAKDLKPKLVLPGFVKSVEDHGYIIDFGVSGKSGFLLKKNASELVKVCGGRKKWLYPGQVVQCVVLSGTDTKAVSVAANPAQVSSAILSQELLVGVGSLLPGNLVKATVAQVAPNGLLVSFLGGFEGVVSSQHLSSPHCHSTSDYPIGKKVKGRLLWVNVATKSAGLTFQDKLLEGVAYGFQGVEIGDKYDAAKVIHVDHSSALYLDLGEGGVVGYSPSWMVTDVQRKEGDVAIKHRKEYRTGTLHEARVVQFNSLDGLAIMSLCDSILEKKYMKYSDICIGDYVEGEVERLGEFGMTVAISSGIHGLCPRIHVSDIQSLISKPSKRYKPGSKVKCRVLNVTPDTRQLLLTCKKSLIRLDAPSTSEDGIASEEEGSSEKGNMILCNYSAAKPGDCYTGVITSVYTYGCVVHFFGHVRGFVHRDETNSRHAASSNPAEEFWEGQPVECRVLSCSPGAQKLSLSFRLDPEGSGLDDVVVGGDSAEAVPPAGVDGGQGHPTTAGVGVVSDKALPRSPRTRGEITSVRMDDGDDLSPRIDPRNRVEVGDIIPVIVVSIKPCVMYVKHNLWKGRVHSTMAVDEAKDGEEVSLVTSSLTTRELKARRRHVFHDVRVGDEVMARVVGIRQTKIANLASKNGATISTLELTTRPSLLEDKVQLGPSASGRRNWRTGEKVTAVISKVMPSGLQVHLSPRWSCEIQPLYISRDLALLMNLEKYFFEGQVVSCMVLSVVKGNPTLSMVDTSYEEGDRIVAYIDKVVTGSHMVLIVPSGCCRLDITDTSDHYQPNPFESIGPHGKLISCCVVKVAGKKIDVSVRRSRRLDSESGKVEDPELNGIEDVEEGAVVRGYVKAITDVGVFVRLGRGLDGRVQITHLKDGFAKHFKKLYSIGELVKAKVLKVHHGTGKVDLTLRLSRVDPEAAKRKRKEEERERKEEKRKRKGELGSDGEGRLREIQSSSEEDENSDDSEVDGSGDEDLPVLRESDDDEEDHTFSLASRTTLSLAGGFKWTNSEGDGAVVKGEEGHDSSSSSSEGELMQEESSGKKSRRQKKAAKKAEEVQLYRKERLLLDTEKEPECAEDFDRLLVSSPNQSSLWVHYMAFYLNTAEVDKARGVAQRALRTIAFAEESEKLNVWVAWLNLENLYGTPDSLAHVFESALQKCEPLDVYKKLLTIYESSGKVEQAGKLYQTMIRKFGGQQWVWSHYMAFLMQRGRCEQARGVLQRALKVLKVKQDHVTSICKLATLEFRHGDPERGRTLFENLISTYPRKVDVWMVYIDAVLLNKDTRAARELFERASKLQLSANKLKAIEKKFAALRPLLLDSAA